MKATAFRYLGTAPGADANTYILFSTVTGQTGGGGNVPPTTPGGYWSAQNGIYRFQISLTNPAGGTLKVFRSDDRMVTSQQVFDSGLLAGVTTTATTFDLFVGYYPDFRVDWLNATVAQTGWKVDMMLNPSPTKIT